MSSTTIGPSMVVDGEIEGDGHLTVAGTVKGRIAVAEAVDVTGSGVVEADIETGSVSIAGQVTGNVRAAGRVALAAEGRLVGDIRAPRIQIAEGATLKGNVDMDV